MMIMNNLEANLKELIIEGVRAGIPKAYLGYIYDVLNKTIPAITNAPTRNSVLRRTEPTPPYQYKTGERIER